MVNISPPSMRLMVTLHNRFARQRRLPLLAEGSHTQIIRWKKRMVRYGYLEDNRKIILSAAGIALLSEVEVRYGPEPEGWPWSVPFLDDLEDYVVNWEEADTWVRVS